MSKSFGEPLDPEHKFVDEIDFAKHQLGLLHKDLHTGNTDIALERVRNFQNLVDKLIEQIAKLDRENPKTPV